MKLAPSKLKISYYLWCIFYERHRALNSDRCSLNFPFLFYFKSTATGQKPPFHALSNILFKLFFFFNYGWRCARIHGV